MLFCAPKLVRDLLSRSYARPSAQTVHPFIRLPVYPSVNPSSICQFHSPSTRPFLRSSIRLFFLLSRLSVRPSVRPPARPPSFHSFVSLSVCPFVSVSPSAFVYLSVCSSRTSIRSVLLAISPSIRLSVRLSKHLCLCSFFRPSVQPFIYLQWFLINKPHFQKFLITAVKVQKYMHVYKIQL